MRILFLTIRARTRASFERELLTTTLLQSQRGPTLTQCAAIGCLVTPVPSPPLLGPRQLPRTLRIFIRQFSLDILTRHFQLSLDVLGLRLRTFVE